MKNSKHVPILIDELIEKVEPKANDTIVDCTLGGGGHLRKIIKKTKGKIKIVGIDLDKNSIERFKEKKIDVQKLNLICDNFKNIRKILKKIKVKKVDHFLLDLGFSTDELYKTKGLSFNRNESLDMRYNPKKQKITAEKIINEYSEDELLKILKKYGEEPKAKCIIKKITNVRKKRRITKTNDLKEIISSCYKKEKIRKISVHTKTFMALRIAVNDEIENLKKFLNHFDAFLKKKGKVAILSFHSLEDREVKNFFKKKLKKCICSEDAVTCSCHHKQEYKKINKKPIKPSKKEINNNPKSRSAKLRIYQKI